MFFNTVMVLYKVKGKEMKLIKWETLIPFSGISALFFTILFELTLPILWGFLVLWVIWTFVYWSITWYIEKMITMRKEIEKEINS